MLGNIGNLLVILIDRTLVWPTGMYKFNMNRRYNRRYDQLIVAAIHGKGSIGVGLSSGRSP